MSKTKPTLRDLAKHLGLALSTVSMALKDSPGIAKSTCERVKRAAAEFGYVPDPRVSSVMGYLKQKRSEKPSAALAYISSYTNDIVLRDHPVFDNYFRGAKAKAEQLGYSLVSFNVEKEGLSGDRLTSILLNRGIEGVIIPPLFKGREKIDLDLDKFASVTFGFSLHQERIRRVTLDHFHGAMLALEKIASKGYRRIGFILGPNTNARMQYRWVAALYAFLSKHREQARLEPFESDISEEGILAWYRDVAPDAIISTRLDWTPHLRSAGLVCGEDFGFAHLEYESVDRHCRLLRDTDLAGEYENSAGLDQKSFYIGGHATELLAADLAMNMKGLTKHPSITLIEGEWQDGATLPVKS